MWGIWKPRLEEQQEGRRAEVEQGLGGNGIGNDKACLGGSRHFSKHLGT